MKRKLSSLLLFAAMLFAAQGNIMAANTKTTITQVTTTVTLSDDVDYIITGDAPFAGDGLDSSEYQAVEGVFLVEVYPD